MASVNSPLKGTPRSDPPRCCGGGPATLRIAFEGGTAGLLPTMHPAIGQGLIDHGSEFVLRRIRAVPGYRAGILEHVLV